MKNLAETGAQVPEIRDLASQLGNDVNSIENFLYQVWYVFPDPENMEYVRTPELQLRILSESNAFVGDCDDAATMAAALVLAAGGCGCLFAIRQPWRYEFSHVWFRAAQSLEAMNAGAFVDIDAVTPREYLPIHNYAEEMLVCV